MSIRNSTKYAFANALKTLLNTKALSKIRVTDLCALCGTERPTFYYHFRDKYDLIIWIYEQDYRHAVESTVGQHYVRQIEQLLLTMQKERGFYRKVFADSTQNALLPYIRQTIVDIVKDSLKSVRTIESSSEELEFTINFLSHAWNGCLMDWIWEKYDLSAAQYAQIAYRSALRLVLPKDTEEAAE